MKTLKEKINKKIVIIIIVILIIIISIFLIVGKFRGKENSENNVPVQAVSILTQNMTNDQNKFAGIVVSQKTLKISKDSNKAIKKVYVEVGDTVKNGDNLFEYDTEEINMKIAEANLEIEKLNNSITNSKKQIENINTEIAANPNGDIAGYNIEKQTLENEIKQTEFNIKAKNNEIAKLKKSLQNVVIKSEIDGIVQSISDAESAQSSDSTSTISSSTNSASEDTTFMTIMQNNQYKIKGMINEQNMYSITSGDRVIIRSRLDETKTWKGTVENIDTSNPENGGNDKMYGDSKDESMTKSSKYPFYVTLDSMEELMLGQHVYIERDIGQTANREGLWLSNYYIVEEGDSYFVWVASSNDKLEKRKIEVGQKNVDFGDYQILSGLTEKDYIAIPYDTLEVGQKVTKYDTMEIPEYMNTDLGEDGIQDGEESEDVINQDDITQTNMDAGTESPVETDPAL